MNDTSTHPPPAPDERPTVLAVDDDDMVLSTLTRALARESYRLITTNKPKDVAALIKANNVDVLVSDLDMPGMTGLELMSLVRRDHPAVVRILLTGGATLEGALHAINQGEVFRFLTKPWDPDDLRQVIRESLQRRALHKSVNSPAAAQRAAEMLAALDSAYPGFAGRPAPGAPYAIKPESVRQAVDELGTPAFSVLWKML